MKLFIIFLSLCILLGLDFIYLSIVMNFVTDQIISVQKFSPKIRLFSAISCYLILFFGLYYFILEPRKSPLDAALLGLVIYSVYEFTNYATFKNWKPSMVIIDTLWGGFLLGFTTFMTYSIEKILK